jgi:hypothetical protein
MKKIKTLIIGLGKIGFSYDEKIKNSFISHAKALKKFDKTQIVCGVDINKSAREKFEKRYKIEASGDIKRSITKHQPKFVIISVSTVNLCNILILISKYKSIKYVLVEKPVGYDCNKVKKIFTIYKNNNKKLFINYNRSYQIEFIKHFSNYKKSKYFKSFFFYNRGLLNNSSHFLNLVLMFLEYPKKIFILNKGKLFNKDIQPSIKLIFNNGEVYLIGGKKNNFTKVKYYFFDGVNRVFSKDNFTKLISYEIKKNRYQLKETVQIKKKNYQTDVYEKIFNYSIKNHIEKINQSGLKLLVLYKKILNSYNRAYGK